VARAVRTAGVSHVIRSTLDDTRDLNVVRDLNPELQTFQQWLTAHKHGFAGA
jgi:hypothetical protein